MACMKQVLVRQHSGLFVVGYLRLEKNQEIEVENDESHWVGHDIRAPLGDPKRLSQGFRLTLPDDLGHEDRGMRVRGRTETVDNNETITIHGNRTESIRLRSLLQAGRRLSHLELRPPGNHSFGLRAEDISVVRTGFLPDGGKWASLTAREIIAILIG